MDIVTEDDIWEYKSKSTAASRLRNKGNNRCSQKFNDLSGAKGKEDPLSSKQTSEIIDVDLEDDFSFTNLNSLKNEKSSMQWTSMFSKAKRKNTVSETHKDNNDGHQKKRRKMSSHSPLKTKTNLQRKNKSPECAKSCDNTKSCSKASTVINYFSPNKASLKKQKVSSSVECDYSFSEENDEFLSTSISDSSVDKNLLTEKIEGSDTTNVSSVEKESEGHLVSMRLDKFSCKTKSKVVDVVIIKDDSGVSLPDDDTYCPETASASDTDLLDSDQETAGGFVRDGCPSHSPSQTCQTGPLQESPSEQLSVSSIVCSPSNAQEVKSPLTCGDSSTISSVQSSSNTKQTSLFSFFHSKTVASTSKPKSSIGQIIDNAIDSAVKNGLSPSFIKPISYFSSKTSVQAHQETMKKSQKATSSSETKYSSGSYGNRGRGKRRPCPSYKRIPDTNITVDAFRYGDIPGCNAYFLTHFHYDHYGGLTKKFAQPLYCSVVTGNLVEKRLGVDKQWIHRLPMWKPVKVDNVTLTLMEANHCPGAVIVLFETCNGKKILHTGDFRASKEMEEYSALKNVIVDELYLDTTYCNPSYAFPNQKTVINFAVSLVEKQISVNPKTLIVCGAYTIGKERIFSAIAKALDCKICVMSDKKKVVDCLDDEELKKRVTLNWSEGRVHVLPMAKLKQEFLFEHHTRHSRFTSIIAFEPTGWTHNNKSLSLNNLQPKWSKYGVTLYGIPYSEHSSYLEMKQFVQFLRPKKILPTVNNESEASRKKMESIFKKWMSE